MATKPKPPVETVVANAIIDAQLRSFSKAFEYERLSTPDQFELYSIFSIVTGKEGIEATHTYFHLDGSEFGLDGAGITIDGEQVEDPASITAPKKLKDAEYWFFQSKTSQNLEYGSISSFFDAVIAFFEDGHIEGSGEQIETLQHLSNTLFENADKLDRNPKVRMFFAYTGKGEISDQIKSLINKSEKKLRDSDLFSDVIIEFLGARELQNGYRRATESSEAKFNFKNRITLPEHPNVREAYLGYISAEELLRAVAVDGDWKSKDARINRKLFFDNVRDYDKNSDVNFDIGRSVDSDSHGFVFRNNGVTIVARDGRPTGDIFHIKDFQIVNGCQTSNVLFENRSKKIDDLQIPLRLIVSNDNKFINSIILGTNSQNPVKMEQFWALKEFLKNFEEFVKSQKAPRNLYFERREHQFSFEDVPERTRIIDPAALLKSVVAMYLGAPGRAGRDFRQAKKEFGASLFQEGHSIRLYHAAAYAYYRLEFLFRTQRLKPDLKKYRLYIMWNISRKLSDSQNPFEIKQKDADRMARKILDYLDDEPRMVLDAVDFVKKLQKVMKKLKLSDDRDSLRSEKIMNELLSSV